MLDEPIVTLPLTAIVGVRADCEEPLLVREIEMTVSALSGMAPEAVRTSVPVPCVQAPALSNRFAFAPPTVRAAALDVRVPDNPAIVMTSFVERAVLGRRVKIIVLATPWILVDSLTVLVPMDWPWTWVERRRIKIKRRRRNILTNWRKVLNCQRIKPGKSIARFLLVSYGAVNRNFFLSGLQNFDSKNEQVVTAPNSSTGASNTISINTTGAAPTTHAVQCFVRSSKGNDRLTSKSTEAMGETKDRTFSPMVRGKNLVGGRTKLSH